MVNHVYQIIYCSERKGRCFRQEITVTAGDAMITATEIMPPNYDIALEQMRLQNEAVAQIRSPRGGLKRWSGYKGCPFCENNTWVKCNRCERLSCMMSKKTRAVCGYCEKILETVDAEYIEASSSGFTHKAWGTHVEMTARPGADRPIAEAPSPHRAESQEGIKKYLQYKKTGELPPGEQQKQLPPPEEPKELPPVILPKLLGGPEEEENPLLQWMKDLKNKD